MTTQMETDGTDGPGTDGASNANVIDLDAERGKRQAAIVKLGSKLERMVRQAREHPLGLYRLCFTDDYGDPIVLKWYHQEWAELLLKNRCAMIEAPRGSTKTTFVVAACLWFLGHNQDLRIKLICGNDANAAKRLSEIKSHIEKDPLYQLVFPDVKLDPDLKNDSLNLNIVRNRHSKDYTVEARGVLSDGTGDRTDLLICDDVCNFKNSVGEPATRPKVLEKVRGDWLNTLNPRSGRVWMIFTPWHRDDANAILKKETKGHWAYKRYAHGKPGNPYHSIFPELFSDEYLRRKRFTIGSLEYARAYLCKALSGDVQVVRSEWLREYGKWDITPQLLNKATVILSIDPTGGKGTKPSQKDPDYIGVSVLLVDEEPKAHFRPASPHRIYVAEAYQVRLTTAQAAQHIIDLYNRWRPEVTVIEAQGAVSLHEWVYERAPHIRIEPVPATLSKRLRLEGVTPWMEDERQIVLWHPRTVEPEPQPFTVVVNSDPQASSTALRDLRTQLVDFPTTHDDICDSVVQGLRFIRQWVLPYETDGNPEPTQNLKTPEVDIQVRSIDF